MPWSPRGPVLSLTQLCSWGSWVTPAEGVWHRFRQGEQVHNWGAHPGSFGVTGPGTPRLRGCTKQGGRASRSGGSGPKACVCRSENEEGTEDSACVTRGPRGTRVTYAAEDGPWEERLTLG